jgi:hypothetical protein
MALLLASGCGSSASTSHPSRAHIPVDPQGMRKEESLTIKDAADKFRPGFYARTYAFKMQAGTQYIIDLRSRDFDAFLRLEDANGKILQEDDDSGGDTGNATDARIIFAAPDTAEYRIVATTFLPGQTGKFTLNVMTATFAASRRLMRLQDKDANVAEIAVLPEQRGVRDFNSYDDQHGYTEYRATVVNQSPSNQHRVTLILPKTETSNRNVGHYLQSIRRSTTVEPQSSAVVSLWQPGLNLSPDARSMGVAVDGRLARTALPMMLRPNQQLWQARTPNTLFGRSILVGPGLTPTLDQGIRLSAVGRPQAGSQPKARTFSVSSSTYNGQRYSYIHVNRFRETVGTAVKDWSTHWLAYTNCDGIVIRDRDLQPAPGEVLDALWQYVESGGSLVILGMYPVPPHWERTREALGGMIGYHPGFGACLVVLDAELEKWAPPRWQRLADMWEESARPWQAIETPDDANSRFPVLDDVRVPIRDLFIIMLAFSIVIGPLSLLVLSWLRRRIWLLWTVPTLSLATCVAVVGFMSVTEDWNGYVRREGVTILDQNTQRATTIGWLGLYSPQTPGEGLRFGINTELSPHLRIEGFPWMSSPRTMEWTDDEQRLTSGWLIARIPAHFLVRVSEQRNERLHVEQQADGSLRVHNGLGADVATLWLAGADGTVHTATEVRADGTATLAPTTRRAAGQVQQLRRAFAQPWLEQIDAMTAAPESYLRPGCYLALLDSAPFIPPGLPAATTRPTRSAVYGILKGP